jgi:hypothetical protein
VEKVQLVGVMPKTGTKLYHGHGHHHFEAGRVLQLPSDVAERLIRDGLVELPGAEAPAAPVRDASTEPAA